MLNRDQFESAYDEVAASPWAIAVLREAGRTGQPRAKRLILSLADANTHDRVRSEDLYAQLFQLGMLQESTLASHRARFAAESPAPGDEGRPTSVALTRDAEELLWRLDHVPKAAS